MNKTNSIISWSGGKDAAMAWYKLSQSGLKIPTFFTTINAQRKRVTMHGTKIELIQAQIKSIGGELNLVSLPEDISMGKYNKLMSHFLQTQKENGTKHVVYGDIFLEDLKEFRNQELQKLNLKAVYPIWKKDTQTLAEEFINLGFKAIVVAVSSKKLSEEHVGVQYDNDFLNSLPSDVDPCGENGEFHTFVYDGPIFKTPVNIKLGKISYHTYSTKGDDECFCEDDQTKAWDKGFWFCELEHE